MAEKPLPDHNHGGVTSAEMAKLGSRAMREPESLNLHEIRSLGACVVGQASDNPVEVLRAAAVSTGLAVDHESFDKAAEEVNRKDGLS